MTPSNSSPTIQDLLLKAHAKQALAPFYIIRSPSQMSSAPTYLEEWAESFLGRILIQENQANQETQARELLKSGHSDILIMRPPAEGKNYALNTGEWEEFFRFLQYDRLALSQRLVFIHQAHRLGSVISNKLLKVLEDPAKHTSIFFMAPAGERFLPTIQSRALEYTTRSEKQESPPAPRPVEGRQDMLQFFRDSQLPEPLVQALEVYLESGLRSLSPLTEALKKDSGKEELLLQTLLDLERNKLSSDYRTKQQLLDALKWYKTAKQFNNSPVERITALVQSAARLD